MDNLLIDIPEPSSVIPDEFKDFERIFFTGEEYRSRKNIQLTRSLLGDHHSHVPSPRPVILRKSMTWTDLLSYFRTFSSLYTYHEKHPEDLQNPDGDIAERFLKSLKHLVSKEGGPVQDSDKIDVEWPLALVLAKKA